MIGKHSFATVAKLEYAKLKADQPRMVEVTGEGARQNGAADFTAMRNSCQKAGHLRTWKQLLSHHCHLDKPFAAKLIEGAPNATDAQRLDKHKATFTEAHGNPDKQRVAREKVTDLLLTAMHNGELDPRLPGCGETPLMDAQIVIDAASVHHSREKCRGTMKNLQKNVFPAFGELLGQDCWDMINGGARTVTKMLSRQRDTRNQVHGDNFDQKKKEYVTDPAEGDASGGCGRHRRGGLVASAGELTVKRACNSLRARATDVASDVMCWAWTLRPPTLWSKTASKRNKTPQLTRSTPLKDA